DAVMLQLEVPLSLPGLQVDGDDALAEQITSGPMAAVVVAGRQLDRQIGHSQFFVNGDLSPGASVPGIGPRIVQPGVVSELAGSWNRVEDPQALAGLDVESTDVALHVGLASRHTPRQMCGPDDDRVSSHGWRRMQPNLAGDEIHR